MNEIMQFEGKKVKIFIIHKIYGKQELKIKNFKPIYTQDKIGFLLYNNEIYIDLAHVTSWEYKDTAMKIISELMEIIIVSI